MNGGPPVGVPVRGRLIGRRGMEADVPVHARRHWTVEQVMTEYDEWSVKGVEALTALQEPPMAETGISLGNLGSHPLDARNTVHGRLAPQTLDAINVI